MNTSNEMRFPNDNFQQNQSSGSKKGLWFIGCGCLTVLLLFCGGGGLFGYLKFFKPSIDFTTESIALATESPQVKELLGEPVTFGSDIQTSTSNESLVLRIPVKGSKGSGVVEVKGKINISIGGVDIARQSMTLEHEGRTIDLDPDAATPEINVTFGDD